jgi:hypothetical protein
MKKKRHGLIPSPTMDLLASKLSLTQEMLGLPHSSQVTNTRSTGAKQVLTLSTFRPTCLKDGRKMINLSTLSTISLMSEQE